MRSLIPQTRIDFMGRRRTALYVSAALLLVALLSLAFRGLNFGIDFTGGTLVEVAYPESADLQMLRTALGIEGFDDAGHPFDQGAFAPV